MSNGLTERRREAVKRLLRLFDKEEIGALCQLLALAPECDIDVVIQKLAELPRFRALQLALKAAEPTVTMLQDITSFLEKHGVSARTTGFALALGDRARPGSSNRIDLSIQEVSKVCSFSTTTLHDIGDDPFSETYDYWRSLRDDWNFLLRKSEPDIKRGRLDVVRSHIKSQNVYKPDKDYTDYEAQRVLRYLLNRVKGLAEVLDRVAQQDRTTTIDHFLRDIRGLLRAADVEVFQRRESYRATSTWQRDSEPNQMTVLRYVSNEFLDKFDRLNEDIRAVADLSDAVNIFDILRVDLWSARPQLYEVWLLVRILDWIEGRGYRINLLQLEPDKGGRIVWHLSYSKASLPCARLEGDRRSTFLFFQLYRPSGDMPDLCLLSESSPNAAPLWAIDAKHSERGGYGIGSYLDTATRYRDSFGAPLSLVVEYFPRTDLSYENPTVFGTGAALVKDARPSGKGMALVLESLSAVHPVTETIVVCVDFSSSFKETRDQAFRQVMGKIRAMEGNVLDSFVCFAGNAITATGLRKLLLTEQHPELPQLNMQDGTSVQGVVAELKRIATDTPATRVMIVGDGQFSEPGWMECVEKELRCVVELCS